MNRKFYVTKHGADENAAAWMHASIDAALAHAKERVAADGLPRAVMAVRYVVKRTQLVVVAKVL